MKKKDVYDFAMYKNMWQYRVMNESKEEPLMVLTKYTLPASMKLKSLRIALVTDLHEDNPGDTIKLIKKAQPDIICIAGDTFERYGIGDDPCMKENPTKLQRALHRLALQMNDVLYGLMGSRRKNNPDNVFRFIREVGDIRNSDGRKVHVFMSLGNHEWWLEDRDEAALFQAGITLLDNAYIKNDAFVIGGLSTKVDENMLDAFCNEADYKILLCHHPEYYEKYLKDRNIDLILAGHAHGGQIRVFGHGLFSPGQGVLPKHHHGVYDGRLVVSAGCTNTASIPRWGNPCEVVVIELREKP